MQGEPSSSKPATGITFSAAKRLAGRPLVQPVESLTSLDLDDLDNAPAQPNLTAASKRAQLQDTQDAQLAKTLLVGKLSVLGLGV